MLIQYTLICTSPIHSSDYRNSTAKINLERRLDGSIKELWEKNSDRKELYRNSGKEPGPSEEIVERN